MTPVLYYVLRVKRVKSDTKKAQSCDHSHILESSEHQQLDINLQPPTIPFSMALLGNVLGFATFGFLARVYALALQRRPIFEGILSYCV